MQPSADSTTHAIELIAALLTPTGLITLIVQQWLAQRAADRRADKQRQQTLADAELKKLEVERLAAELALATSTQHQVVVAKLDENTALTVQAKTEAHAAFKEANSVNNKIASIGLKVADGTPLSPEKDKS